MTDTPMTIDIQIENDTRMKDLIWKRARVMTEEGNNTLRVVFLKLSRLR
jgi:hypothetical protein